MARKRTPNGLLADRLTVTQTQAVCANCGEVIPAVKNKSLRGPDTAWHLSCRRCADLVARSMKLYVAVGNPANREFYECRNCGSLRSSRPGWTTRCHLCFDDRTNESNLEHARLLQVDVEADRSLAHDFAEFRTGLVHRSEPLHELAIYNNALALAVEGRRFERHGWSVLSMDLCGMPWYPGRTDPQSHGTWGYHDACGSLQLMKRSTSALDCVTCGAEEGSRTWQARADHPSHLYVVQSDSLPGVGVVSKFGIGTEQRIRAHVREGANVVQVLLGMHADAAAAERILRGTYGGLRTLPPGAPVSFGTGTECVHGEGRQIQLRAVMPRSQDVTRDFTSAEPIAGPTDWTVVGLVDRTSNEFLVAGVFAGWVPAQDLTDGDEKWLRFAHCVTAVDPEAAEDAVRGFISQWPQGDAP